MFQVHQVTIRQWIREGAMPSTKTPNGRRIRVSRKWCQARIEAMAKEATNGDAG